MKVSEPCFIKEGFPLQVSEIQKKDSSYLMPTYSRFPVALDHGKNATVYDTQGKAYIDFGSGIGVNALGYADEGFVRAVTAQLQKLQHASNLYYTEPQVRLAETLCGLSGYSKVFFGNSGAEANECAIKIARKYSFDTYGCERNEIITLVNSFHGRTITTLSATGQDVFHNYFYPFTEGFCYTDANDFERLSSLVTQHTCAIMMEMIQGEGGVIPLDVDFVRKVQTLCREKDILLICDEVQTGIARTGSLFAFEQYGVTPDLVTLAKGLGGGLPIGACLCNQKLAKTLNAGTHGATFGGNPVSCAGAIEVLSRVASPAFYREVAEKGEHLKKRLLAMPGIEQVRGMGLMRGAVLQGNNGREVAQQCVANGLLVLTAKTLLRFLPPLTITYSELDKGLDILETILKEGAMK